MEIYRQGSVMLIKVRRLPMEAMEEKGNSAEVNVVDGKTLPAKCASMWNAGAERFVKVLEQTALEGLKLEAGVYKVVLRGQHAPKEIKNLFDLSRKPKANVAARDFAMYGYKKAA